MNLVQILGNGIEELYNIPSYMKSEDLLKMWLEYEKSEYDDFEDFCRISYPVVGPKIKRVFVEEIYID